MTAPQSVITSDTPATLAPRLIREAPFEQLHPTCTYLANEFRNSYPLLAALAAMQARILTHLAEQGEPK